MRPLRALWFRLGERFFRQRRDRELASELEAHVAMHVDDYVRNGMRPEEARRRALVALGGMAIVKENYRARRGLPLVETVAQDLRFGWRMLWRTPGFSAIAIAALTIGIGANIAIFSLANAMLLRPLPIADPARVVRVATFNFSSTPYPEYLEYRDGNRTLESLAAFNGASLSLRVDDTPEHIFGLAVSGNYFGTLGVAVARGRTIAPGDDAVNAPGVVVLSDKFWRRRFGADMGVVGRRLTVNGQPYVVVGVSFPAFTGTMSPFVPDVWVPWNGPGIAPPTPVGAGTGAFGRSVHVMGRLRPGSTLEQSQADLNALAAGIAERLADRPKDLRVTVSSAATLSPEFGPATTAFVGFLTAIVGLVLLIACVNIANLLLARSAARRREIGVRLAIGAGRWRLVRQLLTESALVAAIGTATGLGLAWVITRAVSAIELPTPIPIEVSLPFDWRIALFAAGMTGLTTILFGLVPAWQSAKAGLSSFLKEGSAGSGYARSRLRTVLITAQVALSTLLLVTAAVLARSLATAQAIDRGFVGANVITASLDLEAGGYTPDRGRLFLEDLTQRLSVTPGMRAVDVTPIIPLTLSNNQQRFYKEDDDERASGRPLVYFNQVTSGHFATLGIPLVAGRSFTGADRAGTPDVGIINETLARLFWPGENPVGKRLQTKDQRGRDNPWVEVVGVARDSKYVTIGETSSPFLYRPLWQEYQPVVSLMVKTDSDPAAAVPTLRAVIRAMDPELPLFNVSPLDTVTAVSLLPVQVGAAVSGSLGIVALVLAAIGLYGVMSYIVRQRTNEIGMRIALGARPVDVVRVITRQGMRWTIVGLGLGLTASWFFTRLLTGLLYGVEATDTVAFVGITILLGVTAYAACYVPARRASRLDPLVALRHE